MNSSVVGFFIVLLVGEIVAFFTFLIVRKLFTGSWWTNAENDNARNLLTIIGKGVLERLFIYTLLVFNHPQVLILFGALKIGTRFRPEEETKVSSDYFLVGNMVSVFLAFLYYIGYNNFY